MGIAATSALVPLDVAIETLLGWFMVNKFSLGTPSWFVFQWSILVHLVDGEFKLSPHVFTHTTTQEFMHVDLPTVPWVQLPKLVVCKLCVEYSVVLRSSKVLAKHLSTQPSLILDMNSTSIGGPANDFREELFLS
jgi:hypothetical protein